MVTPSAQMMAEAARQSAGAWQRLLTQLDPEWMELVEQEVTRRKHLFRAGAEANLLTAAYIYAERNAVESVIDDLSHGRWIKP